MVAVDAFHKLWRHSQAHHRRETIAFGRRSNALLERAALMMCWRNLIKGISERRNDPTTPAMRLGITSRPWTWRDVLSRRRFPLRIDVPETWMRIYRREWVTPAVGKQPPTRSATRVLDNPSTVQTAPPATDSGQGAFRFKVQQAAHHVGIGQEKDCSGRKHPPTAGSFLLVCKAVKRRLPDEEWRRVA